MRNNLRYELQAPSLVAEVMYVQRKFQPANPKTKMLKTALGH